MATILDDEQASGHPGFGRDPLFDSEAFEIKTGQGFNLSIYTNQCEEVTVFLNDKILFWLQANPPPINLDENLALKLKDGSNTLVIAVVNYSYHIDMVLKLAHGDDEFKREFAQTDNRRSGLVYLGVFNITKKTV